MNATPRPIHASPEAAARYLEGVPDRWRDFAFLLGEWSVKLTRHADDGGPAQVLAGSWAAETLFDGRIVLDRFTVFLPDGRAVSSTVTLRTWCESTQRWEMTFLFSGQPNRLASFTGRKVGDELHLEATGLDLLGRRIEAKVRFFGIADDAFSWEQRSRLEGGDRWYLDSTMYATRVV